MVAAEPAGDLVGLTTMIPRILLNLAVIEMNTPSTGRHQHSIDWPFGGEL